MAQFITLQCIARQCIARLCIRYCARSMRSTTFLPSFLAPAKEYRLSGCEPTLALRLGSTRLLMAAAQAPERPLAVEEALSARDHLPPACRATICACFWAWRRTRRQVHVGGSLAGRDQPCGLRQ